MPGVRSGVLTVKSIDDNTVLRSDMDKSKEDLFSLEERFKDIDYRGTHFKVGEFGTIFRNGKPANIIVSPDGYHKVSTTDRNIGVHRLVAMCWVENDDPHTKVEVNHKDYCRTNNRADNLEWMSHADNIRYSAHRKDISGEKNPNYGNRKLSMFYSENPAVSKEKQGRPGLKNGRCRQINVYEGGNLIASFDYMIPCLQYVHDNYSPQASLDSIRSMIDKAIQEKRSYKGLTFVKN